MADLETVLLEYKGDDVLTCQRVLDNSGEHDGGMGSDQLAG